MGVGELSVLLRRHAASQSILFATLRDKTVTLLSSDGITLFMDVYSSALSTPLIHDKTQLLGQQTCLLSSG